MMDKGEDIAENFECCNSIAHDEKEASSTNYDDCMKHSKYSPLHAIVNRWEMAFWNGDDRRSVTWPTIKDVSNRISRSRFLGHKMSPAWDNGLAQLDAIVIFCKTRSCHFWCYCQSASRACHCHSGYPPPPAARHGDAKKISINISTWDQSISVLQWPCMHIGRVHGEVQMGKKIKMKIGVEQE